MSAKPCLTWRYCRPGRNWGRNGSTAIRSLCVGAIKLCRRNGKPQVNALSAAASSQTEHRAGIAGAGGFPRLQCLGAGVADCLIASD
jgi:hypothetical protein